MNIGYKKLQNGYIAELEILGKTNENRKNIANPQYAKYRTSKVKVLKIFYMNDETQVIKQMSELHDENFIYIEGKEIDVDYDEDVNEVCSRGIYYFKTPYQAKMWNLYSNNYIGKYIVWYDNGTLRQEGEFKNGKEEGKWLWWHENGNKWCEGEYKDGKKEGKWIILRESGNKKQEGEYKDGKLEGKWIEWGGNDTKVHEGEYKDGKREGKWIWWWPDNTKMYEGEYEDGVKIKSGFIQH